MAEKKKKGGKFLAKPVPEKGWLLNNSSSTSPVSEGKIGKWEGLDPLKYDQDEAEWYLVYLGNNQFRMTVCVTIILKVLANVEILIPSYGFCTIPPAEEFAESVCDEFFSLPLFPPASLCNEGTVSSNVSAGTCTHNCGCHGRTGGCAGGCTSCNRT